MNFESRISFPYRQPNALPTPLRPAFIENRLVYLTYILIIVSLSSIP